jgi:hypothetical protein
MAKPKMKPKPKTKKGVPAEQMTTQPDLLSLLRTMKNRQRSMDEDRGSMGNAVKLAVEKKHLNKRAFAIYRTLERLPDSRLGPVLRNLLHYVEIGGLNDRATAQLEFSVLTDKPAKKAKPVKVEPTQEPEPMTVTAPAQMDLSERPDLSLLWWVKAWSPVQRRSISARRAWPRRFSHRVQARREAERPHRIRSSLR